MNDLVNVFEILATCQHHRFLSSTRCGPNDKYGRPMMLRTEVFKTDSGFFLVVRKFNDADVTNACHALTFVQIWSGCYESLGAAQIPEPTATFP